jgi:hypothetical protein
MTVTTFQTAIDGVNPFVAEGPAVLGSGVIVPQFRVGHVAYGDAELEAVYCKYTSVANQNLFPGLAFIVDDDYNATIASTSTTLKGTKVMICLVGLGYGTQGTGALQATVTGQVYYLWLARSGNVPVMYTAAAGGAGSQGELTATAGSLSFPAALTGGAVRAANGLYITKAVGGTFTGDVTNGSTSVINLVGLTIDSGPAWVGATLSSTGIAGAQTITAIQYTGTKATSLTLSAAATATAAATTITASLQTAARVQWPFTT